jgi:hypothetical protein
MAFGQTVVPKSLGKVTVISAGWQHNCAIKVTGKVTCWGRQITGVSKSVPPVIH